MFNRVGSCWRNRALPDRCDVSGVTQALWHAGGGCSKAKGSLWGHSPEVLASRPVEASRPHPLGMGVRHLGLIVSVRGCRVHPLNPLSRWGSTRQSDCPSWQSAPCTLLGCFPRLQRSPCGQSQWRGKGGPADLSTPHRASHPITWHLGNFCPQQSQRLGPAGG